MKDAIQARFKDLEGELVKSIETQLKTHLVKMNEGIKPW